MTSLFVIQGRDQGRRFELEGSPIRLGRDPTSSVRLHDTEVSRRHAEIQRTDDGSYELVDLGSSNGTFVNTRRIDSCRLESGDRVQLGQTVLIYTGTQSAIRPAAAPGQVDIVPEAEVRERSQIVRSISQEEAGRLLSTPPDAASSPWLARAQSHLQVMYRTTLAVSHTLDIEQLLQRIVDLIFEWVEADRACIMLIDRKSSHLVPKVRRDRAGRFDQQRIQISASMLSYVTERQEGVLTTNALEDERWDTSASILRLGVREAICVPLQGRYGMVGVIYIDTYSPPGWQIRQPGQTKFTDEHLQLMVAIAHQAALAIEDTHFYSAMVESERLAAIGQTIAGLSHHIKNILQGIRGGSYLIEEGLASDDPDMARKGWSIVEKNQERISTLVLDMLTFSKERQPEMVPSQLNQIVGDVLELLEARVREAGIRLEDSRAEGIPERAFDGEGIYRAVLNVVGNAIDACRDNPDGRVAVSTGWDAETGIMSVVVDDNGEGIPPENLDSIFSLFESRKGNRGTGLGLPVSQKIIREHGGEILVTSVPGEGSRFVLQWPAAQIEVCDEVARLGLPTDTGEDSPLAEDD